MWIVNFAGVVLIAAIVWWFWIYKKNDSGIAVADNGEIVITVENGVYNPAIVKIPEGKATTVGFIRKDASPCAATVVFSGIDISADLPLEKRIDIKLPSMEPGHYNFACQMQMYRGELIVE